MTIELGGETVMLLPQRALYWPRQRALLVADLHWGKDAAFRAAAVPVPAGTIAADLRRLGDAVRATGARRLIVLGDLIHARKAQEPRTLEAVRGFRAAHAGLDILNVRGNHDRRAGDPPPDLGIVCVDEPHPAAPFVLAHRPGECDAGHVLAGPVHPGVRLQGHARQRERMPCFLVTPRFTVLPAFSDFTGMQEIEPAAGDRVYGIAGDHVLELTASW